MKIRYVIGIDEVGRGPLAGPLAVCALAAPNIYQKHFRKTFPGVFDSKQVKPKDRERWLEVIKSEREAGRLNYAVTFVGPETIDGKGLTFCINKAIASSLKKLKIKPEECRVLLDGGIKAPPEYIFQETIIKGDAKEAVIGLASIAAKVARDNRMKFLSKKYSEFDFAKHKGYGTLAHRQAIEKFGLTKIHRRSFLKKMFETGSEK